MGDRMNDPSLRDAMPPARTAAAPLVRLSGISKRYGEVSAVKQLDLKINRGDFLAILGPSGCGKTTLLRIIGGFVAPTTGMVEIDGQDVTGLGPEKRPTNTVFQGYGLFPHMSVRQNIAYGLKTARRPAAEIQQRVEQAIALVRLEEFVDRSIDQLSGGQQQRVALARALVLRPQVLLLDEPLGALDAQLRKSLQVELKALQAELGITFIYVTHDQEEALTMSDRIAVMSKGVVLQIGAPQEIYERPASKYVADFIGETNFIDGVVRAQDGSIVEVELEGTGTVCVESSRSFTNGQQVSVALRPEKLRLNTEIKEGNNLKGRVEDVIYIGTDTHYGVRFTGDQKVRVREQNVTQGQHEIVQIADEVSVSFSQISPRILTE